MTALLVPAFLLTGDRLLDPQGGTWVRLIAFTPYAVLLYAAALLPLLLAWWRGRRLLARHRPVAGRGVAGRHAAARVLGERPVRRDTGRRRRVPAPAARDDRQPAVRSGRHPAGGGGGVGRRRRRAGPPGGDARGAVRAGGGRPRPGAGAPCRQAGGRSGRDDGVLPLPAALRAPARHDVRQLRDGRPHARRPGPPARGAPAPAHRGRHRLADRPGCGAARRPGDLGADARRRRPQRDHGPRADARPWSASASRTPRRRRTRSGSPPGRRPARCPGSASRCRPWCRSTTCCSARGCVPCSTESVTVQDTDHRALVATVAVSR